MDQGCETKITVKPQMFADVLRCGCGDPDQHNGVRGKVFRCPNPLNEFGDEVHEAHNVTVGKENTVARIIRRIFKR